jgi:hypothetical protein
MRSLQRANRFTNRRRHSTRFVIFAYLLQIGVFVTAFLALHFRLTGSDPDLPNDHAILHYLGGFALILYGGVLVLVLVRFMLQIFLIFVERPRK